MSSASRVFPVVRKFVAFFLVTVFVVQPAVFVSFANAQNFVPTPTINPNPTLPQQGPAANNNPSQPSQNTPRGSDLSASALRVDQNDNITVQREGNSGGGVGGGAGGGGGLGSAAGGLAGSLACKLSLGQLTSKPSQDEVPTADEKNRKNTDEQKTKHCTLDGIAFAIKETLVKKLIEKIVGFANGGMEGGPSYMTNPDTLFRDVADEKFENFINDTINFSGVCSAWKAEVRLAVAMNYANATSGRSLPSGNQFSNSSNSTNSQGGAGNGGSGGSTNSLNDAEYCPANVDPVTGIEDLTATGNEGTEDFNGEDFWDRFAELTDSVNGNPVTSYLNLQDDLARGVEYETQKKADEVSRNQGYFDLVSCNSGSGNYGSNPQEGTFQIGNKSCAISTPGQNVKDSVQEGLMSDLRRLELADEFDEVFAALIGMLISYILDQALGGLGGSSDRGSNGRSFIQEYGRETSDVALIQSRQGLLNELQEYLDFVETYITEKRRSVETIYNDGILPLFDVQQCYLGKFNTVVTAGTFTPVPREEYADLTATAIDNNLQWRRAVFQKNYLLNGNDDQVTSLQLLPPYGGAFSSYSKYTYYQDRINSLASNIAQLESEIAGAQASKEKVSGYVEEVGAYTTDTEFVSGTISSSTVLDLLEEESVKTGPTVIVDTGNGARRLPENVTIQTILDIYQKALLDLVEYDTASAAAQADQLETAMDEFVNGTGNAIGTAADLATCRSFVTIYKQPYNYVAPENVNVQGTPGETGGASQTNDDFFSSNDWARNGRGSSTSGNENPNDLIGTFAKMLPSLLPDISPANIVKTLTQSGNTLNASPVNEAAKETVDFTCSNGKTEDDLYGYIKRVFDTAAGDDKNFISKMTIIDDIDKRGVLTQLSDVASNGTRELVVNRAALIGECLSQGIAKESFNQDIIRSAASIKIINNEEKDKKAASLFDQFASSIWTKEERDVLKNGPLQFVQGKFVNAEAAKGIVNDMRETFTQMALGKDIATTIPLVAKQNFMKNSPELNQAIERVKTLLNTLKTS